VLCFALAEAQTSHIISSDKPLFFTNGESAAPPANVVIKGSAALAWTEATTTAYAHAVIVVNPFLGYDFMLTKTTSSTADTINGYWDIRKNGTLVCTGCVGKAYLVSVPPAQPPTYFKIYIGNRFGFSEKWGYGAHITNRFDF
ncbi:MAG: hypothetical protein M3R67_13395, partial [Acidobacteriota bacterium]|nr:hypothetical protein [Acidobacteriota bacterium]